MNIYELRSSKVVARSGYRQSAIAAQVIASIIAIAVAVYLFTLYLEPYHSDSWSSKRHTEAGLRTMFLIFALIWFALSIMVTVKIPAMAKSFICVTELGVYGSGGKSFYFASQPFEIPKEQITDIKIKNNCVIISSGGNVYKCITANPSVIDYLTNINNLRPDTDKWTCPSCNSPASASFCVVCGTKKPTTLTQNTTNNNPRPSTNEWKCPNCNSPASASFCVVCGTKKPTIKNL